MSSTPDALFRAAADQAPQVMWIVNGKGAVTYLNRFWYELVGGRPPQWHGHEWMKCVHPDDVEQMRERWRGAAKAGTMFEGTRRVKGRDSRWHILSYRAVPVREGGEVTCWVGMDSDITDLVTAQAALRLANQELEKFAYTVSHDLRAPLVTIDGFISHLRRELGEGAPAKARHYMERIEAAGRHMSGLVEGLLALSQAERRRLRREDVDIAAMARDILDMLTRQQPGRHVRITIEPGLVAHADPNLVTSLLDNLLGNAWKFTAARDRAEIFVGRETDSTGESIFYVKDNGAGFDMSQASHLFTAFERLHDNDEFPGLGIGLATVQRVCARHGGRAWAQSEPDKGACFFFTLPDVAHAARV
ncbi:MAG TPA: ATP-binding protein [Ramlibacter sp.]|jgi:PAS domain S-box-containing protein|nr:ATP-binding protein [Ramlibacter sp.]